MSRERLLFLAPVTADEQTARKQRDLSRRLSESGSSSHTQDEAGKALSTSRCTCTLIHTVSPRRQPCLERPEPWDLSFIS